MSASLVGSEMCIRDRPVTVARDEGDGADVEMGDEKKTLTRAAHVPWLELGSKGMKSMIPGMDGPS
eukprot:9063285-Alexandrium_andersonii.AAC.1